VSFFEEPSSNESSAHWKPDGGASMIGPVVVMHTSWVPSFMHANPSGQRGSVAEQRYGMLPRSGSYAEQATNSDEETKRRLRMIDP
jgi:hypothetical protein